MAEPVADIVLVRTNVIEHVLANTTLRYVDSVSGDNSDYVSKQEFTDAILICDNVLVSDVVATAGHPYRSMFMVPSSPLAHGDLLPAHLGEHGDVQISVSGVY